MDIIVKQINISSLYELDTVEYSISDDGYKLGDRYQLVRSDTKW